MKFKVGDKVQLLKKCSSSINIAGNIYRIHAVERNGNLYGEWRDFMYQLQEKHSTFEPEDYLQLVSETNKLLFIP
jgi:hypothetical protein